MSGWNECYGAPFVKKLYRTALAQKLHVFSYICTYLAISVQRQLSLHACIALKRVGGKHGILSEEKLGVLFQ